MIYGEYIDSIWGFVGDDFIGSGYDYEFYESTLELIGEDQPEYIDALNNIVLTEEDSP